VRVDCECECGFECECECERECKFKCGRQCECGCEYECELAPCALQGMKWGAMSMVDAERRLLANALLDPSNTHFTLLCKSTVPLLDFNTTFHFITQAPNSFLHTNLPSYVVWSDKLLRQVPAEDWRRGSAWFTLQRKHASLVIADTEYYKAFERGSLSQGNEEHYFQTLLRKLDGGHLTDHSLMYAHWSHASSEAPLLRHPRAFHSPDVTPAQLAHARGPRCAEDEERWWQCRLFARRFAEDTLQPLMSLLPLAMPARVEENEKENRDGQGGGKEGAQGAGEGKSETEGGEVEPLLCPEDEDLFARAVAMGPASGTPRVAFLFLVRGPLPLGPSGRSFLTGSLKSTSPSTSTLPLWGS